MSEPTTTDLARWAKWDDLRARQAAAATTEERVALAREEDALRDEGIRELLEQDVSNEECWWWLSFVDRDENAFLGVCIVRGGGVLEAATNARLIGCNPGGEVAAYPIERLPPEKYRNRLLTEGELETDDFYEEEEMNE